MMNIDRGGLRKLFRDALSGEKVEDLTLLIKSGTYKDSGMVGNLPVNFEKRKNVPGGEYIVGLPEKRLINPVSRLPTDYWTVIYKNKIVVQGEFSEVHQALQETFRKVISYPYTLTRLSFIYGGIFTLIIVCFFSGFAVGRFLTDKNQAQESLVSLDKSLDGLMRKQEMVQSILDSMSGRLKEAQDKQLKEIQKALVASQQQEPKKEKSDEMSFTERLKQESESRDLNRLIELEGKRRQLLTMDKELEKKGLMPLHQERRNIQASIENLDQEIAELKKKYNP